MNKVDKLIKKRQEFTKKINKQIIEIQYNCNHSYERISTLTIPNYVCKKCNRGKWK